MHHQPNWPDGSIRVLFDLMLFNQPSDGTGEERGVFEAISFGIVAQCGPSSVALALPIDQQVDLKKLKKAHPEMARLWEFPGEITRRVFGESDLFTSFIIARMRRKLRFRAPGRN